MSDSTSNQSHASEQSSETQREESAMWLPGHILSTNRTGSCLAFEGHSCERWEMEHRRESRKDSWF